MDRDEALDTLAAPYARALRLADARRTHVEIGDDLGIEPAAVATLLDIGARKLARAMGRDAPASPDDAPT